jgi:periplasmic protein TonB
MNDYVQGGGDLSGRFMLFAAISALHLLAVYVLAHGVGNSGVHTVQGIVQTRLIQREKLPVPPPPPPPPLALRDYLPAQVVPPDITIALPAELPPPMLVTSIESETMPPPAPRMVVAVPTTRPRPISVPNGLERYPAESIRAKESGEPTITICISATGTVESVQVTKSSGFARLDQAAVGIGKEAKFKPAMERGEPVPACLPYRIKFAINNV